MMMSWNELYLNSPRTLTNRLKGFYKKVEQQEKNEYIRLRLFTTILVNTQLKKPLTKPEQLLKFAWEESKPRQLTKEQLLKLIG